MRELAADIGKAGAGEVFKGSQKTIKAIAVFERLQLRADISDFLVGQFFAKRRDPGCHARGSPGIPILVNHTRDRLKVQPVEVVLHGLQEVVGVDVGLAEDPEDLLVWVEWMWALGL